MTVGHDTAMAGVSVSSAMNYGDMHPIAGDGDMRGMDCKCANMCDDELTPLPNLDHNDPQHNDYVHYCDADPSKSCPPQRRAVPRVRRH